MFWTRLLSGVILVAVALAAVIAGGPVLFALVAAISLIGMFELYRVYEIHNRLIGCAGYAAAAGYFALLYFGCQEFYLALLAGAFLLVMCVYVFSFPKVSAEPVSYTHLDVYKRQSLISL